MVYIQKSPLERNSKQLNHQKAQKPGCDAILVSSSPSLGSCHWAIILLEKVLLSFVQSRKWIRIHGGFWALRCHIHDNWSTILMRITTDQARLLSPPLFSTPRLVFRENIRFLHSVSTKLVWRWVLKNFYKGTFSLKKHFALPQEICERRHENICRSHVFSGEYFLSIHMSKVRVLSFFL